ncbi:MAG TPA: hypothetical protein VGB26_03805 [Nitrospiria bacterium]|jgi:hypothetical protein
MFQFTKIKIAFILMLLTVSMGCETLYHSLWGGQCYQDSREHPDCEEVLSYDEYEKERKKLLNEKD